MAAHLRTFKILKGLFALFIVLTFSHKLTSALAESPQPPWNGGVINQWPNKTILSGSKVVSSLIRNRSPLSTNTESPAWRNFAERCKARTSWNYMLHVLPPSCGIFLSGRSSGYFLPLSSTLEELKQFMRIFNNSLSPSVSLWPSVTHSLSWAVFPRISYMSFYWLGDSLLLDLQISSSSLSLPSCFLFCAPSHFKCPSYRLYDRCFCME